MLGDLALLPIRESHGSAHVQDMTTRYLRDVATVLPKTPTDQPGETDGEKPAGLM